MPNLILLTLKVFPKIYLISRDLFRFFSQLAANKNYQLSANIGRSFRGSMDNLLGDENKKEKNKVI